MPPLDKSWDIHRSISPEADQELRYYPPVLRQLLFNRGCTTAEQAAAYLAALPPEGTEAANLATLPQAVERIRYAIQRNEPMAVYGDYDADGVTATALLVTVLKALGANVTGYIPNRFDEGYGLNTEALDSLSAQGVRLIITVDCGIRSTPEAEHARRIGLDMIISDHHHPAEDLPSALAIINPKQPGDTYPYKELAGVGLAYKLASALIGREADDLLDLVALGTVADLAPLTGENRSLVRRGLDKIRLPARQGLMALIGASGLKPRRINSTDIGFILGPRLNAAGRLESALDALNLLTTQDVFLAAKLAQKLDSQNRERQQLTQKIQVQAEQLALAHNPNPLLLFAADPEFNPGVVGLAASRLTETYYRPAIVAYLGEDFTRGSCRSIPEFHITWALDQCTDLLEHHGGHAAAAGFTVRNSNLPELVHRLEAIAEQELGQKNLTPKVPVDMEISLSALVPEYLEYLEGLQPTGIGNPQAYFVSRELKVSSARLVGKEAAHLKLTVTDGWITYDAIAFRQAGWYNKLPGRVDLLYSFEKDDFFQPPKLQLNIKDIKPSETSF